MSYYLETALKNKSQQKIQTEFSKKFFGKDFWIWNKTQHESEYDRTGGNCCFNHILSLPSKLGVKHALYESYQRSVIDALEKYRRLAIIKPRSSGLTELMLRWAEYIALRDQALKGHQILIVSAPGENLSISFIRRMKAHLEPHFGQFDTNQNLLEINSVRLEALASHNLRTLRGRDKVAMILIEESDFWNKSEEDELLPTVLPHIQKSDPYIITVSTPGRKGSLMERMFTEDMQTEEEERKHYSLFHKIKIDYRDVELYSQEDIRQAMLQPNFRREFGGEWGFGVGTGSLFSYADLDAAVNLGRMYANTKYNQDHASRPYPYTVYPESVDSVAIGVDTAGGSSSEFAICGLQIWNKRLHVFTAETYRRANHDQMIERVMNLWKEGTSCRGTVFVDGSNPIFIRSLKTRMSSYTNERIDFEEHIDWLRAKGFAGDHDINLSQHMSCVPVYFQTHGPRLLQIASVYVQRHLVSIHPNFRELISSIQSAKTREHAAHDWALDKLEYSHDILDAFRCCCYDLKI